jgi:uncharacterized membrane protein YeaQ/YmgE (transglycosylase-associated protein family)
MFHLIWYLIVGLIAGLVANSALNTHLTLLWTVVLGILGSLVGGFFTHLFARPRSGSFFHTAGIIFSSLGALPVLFLLTKVNLHLGDNL